VLSWVFRTTISPEVPPRRPTDHGRPPPGRGRGLLLLPLLAAALLVLTAGTAGATSRDEGRGSHHGSEHGSHTLRITTQGLSYRLSTTHVASGLVTTKLVNTGSQPHQAQLARFAPGKGLADFEKTIHGTNPDSALALFDRFVGGPNVVAPGDRQTTFQNLAPGNYLVLCFVPDKKTGAPHFLLGMYATFQVVGPARSGSLRASQTVLAVDEMRFVVPDVLQTDSIVRFENHATEDVHEFTIGRLHAGKTATDVMNWAKSGGLQPFDDSGGAGALSPGGREWFTLDLAPGRYVAFCLVPDDKTGVPHAATGMVKEFRVDDD
jgi:hypothetical protein